MKLLSFSEYSGLNLNESFDDYTNSIDENVKYHIENELTISESIYRIGSDAYLDFVNKLRELNENNLIQLSPNDKFIVEKLKTGTKAKYQGETVNLDTPRRTRGDEPGKFIVFRDGGKKTPEGDIKAVRITWGQPGATIKNGDEEARKSFLARHKCSEKTLEKDGMSAGWWACNVHKFWKQLGLSSDLPW